MNDIQCRELLDVFLKSDDKCAYITGGWGVGKTYLVQHLDSECEIIRLSLFGVASETDLFAQLKECLTSTATKVGKTVDAAVDAIQKVVPDNIVTRLSFFGIKSLIQLATTWFGENKRAVIVIDDIERLDSKMPISSVFGLVDYCKDLNIKFILICNEPKIISDNQIIGLVGLKEKVVDVECHLDVSSLETKRLIVGEVPDDIVSVIDGIDNLRTLFFWKKKMTQIGIEWDDCVSRYTAAMALLSLDALKNAKYGLDRFMQTHSVIAKSLHRNDPEKEKSYIASEKSKGEAMSDFDLFYDAVRYIEPVSLVKETDRKMALENVYNAVLDSRYELLMRIRFKVIKSGNSRITIDFNELFRTVNKSKAISLILERIDDALCDNDSDKMQLMQDIICITHLYFGMISDDRILNSKCSKIENAIIDHVSVLLATAKYDLSDSFDPFSWRFHFCEDIREEEKIVNQYVAPIMRKYCQIVLGKLEKELKSKVCDYSYLIGSLKQMSSYFGRVVFSIDTSVGFVESFILVSAKYIYKRNKKDLEIGEWESLIVFCDCLKTLGMFDSFRERVASCRTKKESFAVKRRMELLMSA